MTNLVFNLVNADVVAAFYSSNFDEDGEIYEELTISMEETENITVRMREFEDARIFGTGGNVNRYFVYQDTLQFSSAFNEHLSRNEWLELADSLPVTLIVVDNKNHEELTRRAGVPVNSNILINHSRTQASGNWAEFAPFVFDNQILQLQNRDDDAVTYLPLHGELRGSDVPNEIIQFSAMSYVIVLVPEVNAHFYVWSIQTEDSYNFIKYARSFFHDMLPYDDGVGFVASIFDQASEERAVRSLFHTIMIAMYSFIGMLTLIALTNIISTISTNVRSRSREFAILQSVGMTHKGLRSMLNLESILCSVKSLIYGVPLGVGVSYMMYLFMMESVWFPYELPWLAIIQCIGGVFAIAWLTMRFAVSRLRDKNIVDSIRSEAGKLML